MEASSPSPAVLFVDLTDSTRLYERLGDSEAREFSSAALRRWEEIVDACDGRVVKRIGDELMCVFGNPEHAARAAMDILTAMDEGLPGVAIELHAKVGLHAGPLLEEDDDVFGDTVNLAARMVALAKPGQILTTAATAAALPPFYAACVQPRGSSAVKGKSGSIGIFELVWKAEDQTRLAGSRAAPLLETLRLWVRCGEQQLHVDAQERVLRMGRHAHNELVVEGDLVSRSHARIEYRNRRFVLIDESSNGTWLHPVEASPRRILKDELFLPEKGHLGLGESLPLEHPHSIHFELDLQGEPES